MIPESNSSPGHVIVSGGSRGLGKALVTALLENSYRVSTFSRSSTEFTDGLQRDHNFYYAPANTEDRSSLKLFLRAATDRLGNPYALINCAGIATDGVLAIAPEDSIERVLDVNLKGTLHLTRLVVRRMLLAKSGGVILNITSIVGLRGYSGLAAYAATKGGMDAMTRSLARELGDRNIRVISIAPGYLETEMTRGLGEKQREQIIRRTPLGRLGTPQDVVGPALFFLSRAAGFITGQVLAVDGGITT